ncbi:MAG: phosphodiesterase [Porticoccaceae bacterium]
MQAAATQCWRLIQISDPHIGDDREHRLAGIQTHESYRAVLAAVAAMTPIPDMVMVTGDIAARGSAKAYELFNQQIKFLDLPYAWLPGNHDDFAVMQQGLSSSPYWPLLEFGPWRVLSLNTAVAGQAPGALAADELEFLGRTLAREVNNPAVIFMHHPPVPVGCDWLDRQAIANAAELAAVVGRHRNVKAIFTGHVHQVFTADWAGTVVRTTPSTCFQFAVNSRDFALADDPPGFRWIDLHGDGRLDTGVVYLDSDNHQRVDHGSSGY